MSYNVSFLQTHSLSCEIHLYLTSHLSITNQYGFLNSEALLPDVHHYLGSGIYHDAWQH